MVQRMKYNALNYLMILLAAAVFNTVVYPQFGSEGDQVKIKTYQSFDKAYAGGELKLAVKVNVVQPWHINSNKPYDDFLIPSALSVDTTSGFKLSKIIYPNAKDIKLGFSDSPLSVFADEVYIGALLSVPLQVKPGTYRLAVTLDYQACNDNTCLAPTSVSDTIEINVADNQTPVNEINQEIFSKIDLAYTPPAAAAPEKDAITSTLEESGLLIGLLLVFIGGLALNLTPCVYPLIPITIGYFGGQSEGSTSKLTLMGIFYVIGIAITYSVIGVVTALSGAVFGALLQNTFVIIFISLIFVVLSLSMFGVYEFKLPDALVAKAGGAKTGLYGAFFMGLTMGIVAAPCIGPFVLGLVTYVAAKGDPFFGFLMFFVLAVGLGTPYLILAIFSGKIKKLPRAGDWMDGVKHVFGFLLIGMAVYFLLPLLPKNISGYLLPAFMIFTAVYLLLFDKVANKIKGFRLFKIVFSVILLAVAAYSLIPKQTNSVAWEHYSESVVPASFEAKRGMIIDFYADWCIPCKELDAATFSDQRVINETSNFYTYKADMTKSLSPEVEALRNKYKIIGVPTVLIINSKGEEVKRITGFVNADEFYTMIKNVN